MKKFVVSLLLLLPFGLVAQEIKIAIVDQNQIFNLMPEYTEMENAIMAKTKQYDDMIKSMQDDYTRKYEELTMQADSLAENIRMLRIQEVEEIERRIQNVYNVGQEEIKKTQEEHFIPMQEKFINAINSVGDENGYTFIIYPNALLYKGRGVEDATEKVKAKMGIK